MREARLIIPMACESSRADLERWLVEYFGGFTTYSGRGGWRAPDGTVQTERIRIYDIASAWGPDDLAELRDIISVIGLQCAQQSIYVRWPDGVVEIVPTLPLAA